MVVVLPESTTNIVLFFFLLTNIDDIIESLEVAIRMFLSISHSNFFAQLPSVIVYHEG